MTLVKSGGQVQFTQENPNRLKTKWRKNRGSSEIKDKDGKVVMTEKADLKDGKILHQFVEQLQINEAYELKVDGKKATFFHL